MWTGLSACDHVLHGVTWHLSSEHLAQLQCQECSPLSHQQWLIGTARWQNSEQPRTAGMGTAFILPAASSTHHTLLPHWPGKHDWCCSLEQPIFSCGFNLLHSWCVSPSKPPLSRSVSMETFLASHQPHSLLLHFCIEFVTAAYSLGLKQ